MPRRFRLPEGAVRRLMLGAGVLLPLLCYVGLRTLPPTRSFMLANESAVVRGTTRLTQAFRYVFFREELEQDELGICKEENAELAEEIALLRASNVGPMRTLPIEVVARAYSGDTHKVLVWKQGGDPLVIGEGVGAGKILYGLVTEVKTDLAVVETVTSEKSAIPGMISGKETTVGIVEGTGGAWLEFSYVPKGSDVVVGDSVVTSGLGGSVVRGLVIGTIREVINADPSPFYRIKVEPLVYSDAWWEGEIFHLPML
jgi:rod shape-determining protein MreC